VPGAPDWARSVQALTKRQPAQARVLRFVCPTASRELQAMIGHTNRITGPRDPRGFSHA